MILRFEVGSSSDVLGISKSEFSVSGISTGDDAASSAAPLSCGELALQFEKLLPPINAEETGSVGAPSLVGEGEAGEVLGTKIESSIGDCARWLDVGER